MDLSCWNLLKNTLKYSIAKTTEKQKPQMTQGSFTKMPVCFDNNVHSHLILKKRLFLPSLSNLFLDKKTQVPPTANMGLSPLSHTTVSPSTRPSNQKSLSGKREIIIDAHHCWFFLLNALLNNLFFLHVVTAKTTLTQNQTFSSSHTQSCWSLRKG